MGDGERLALLLLNLALRWPRLVLPILALSGAFALVRLIAGSVAAAALEITIGVAALILVMLMTRLGSGPINRLAPAALA